MLQINGLGLSGKDWVMSAIEDRLNTLQKEKITTVTYYTVTLPTPHTELWMKTMDEDDSESETMMREFKICWHLEDDEEMGGSDEEYESEDL